MIGLRRRLEPRGPLRLGIADASRYLQEGLEWVEVDRLDAVRQGRELVPQGEPPIKAGGRREDQEALPLARAELHLGRAADAGAGEPAKEDREERRHGALTVGLDAAHQGQGGAQASGLPSP